MASLALIDLSSIYHAQWHASEGEELNASYRKTLDKVHAFASDSDYVAVCVDTPPYRRREILPEYKANRDQKSEVFLEQFRRVKETLTKRYPLLGAEGYEADDAIASVCANVGDRVDEVFVYSGDKDLMQLVDDRTTFVSVQTRNHYGPDQVHAKFGVFPDKMAELLALMGDRSDNVAGVPGVGEKRAAALLNEFGTMSGVIEAAKRGDVKGKLGEALVEHAQAARSAHIVVLLDRKAPIDVDSIFTFRERKQETMADENNDVEDADFNDVDNLIGEPEVAQEQPVKTEPTEENSEAPEQDAKPAPEKPKSDALAVVAPSWDLALEPTNTVMAVRLAKVLIESRVFGNLPNWQAALGIILRGRALGFDSTTALMNFHLVEGRASMSAQLIVGLVLKSGKAEYFQWVESDDNHALWVTKRIGAKYEQKLEWTMETALKAGLVTKDREGKYHGVSRKGGLTNWDKVPRTMLRHRCGTELARSVYPDVVAGLYDPDELEER